MNQTELNRVALDAISDHITRVFLKLRKTLVSDLKKRSENISGAALFHVHNMSLFQCMIWLNSIVALKDDCEGHSREYLNLAASLEPKFKEIMEALRDFEPAK